MQPKTVLPLSVQKMTGTGFKKLIQGKEKENSPSGGKEITLTEELRVIFPELSRGCTGTAVKMLQVFLQVPGRWYFRNRNRKCASYISEEYESVG